MADLNLGKMISRFVNYQTLNKQAPQSQPAQNSSFTPAPQSPAQSASPTPLPTPRQAQMAGSDQSV